MKQTIEVSTAIYSRLESLAEGFDTPEAVIARLLDNIEGKEDKKPTLVFDPSDEDLFKHKLIEAKEAEVVLYKIDGTREVSRWKANSFSETSNLRGNLWSGYLRGWKSKGIKNAEFSILPKGLNLPDDDTEQRKVLALELGLTFDEISELEYEILENSSEDGLVYNLIVQFSGDNDKDILDKINGLSENLCINVDSSILYSR
ncbi:MAG: hypothetical protein COB14_03115 [Alphaproteobacteria bacterium]|nr:MAG: hypothetical protein COB14_03115 [Alphaproteobacteria bacterium]